MPGAGCGWPTGPGCVRWPVASPASPARSSTTPCGSPCRQTAVPRARYPGSTSVARSSGRTRHEPGTTPMSRSHAKLAINRFRERRNLDDEAVSRFLERFGSPIVESSLTTFLHRGEADGVSVRHRVVGLPDPLPMRRIEGTDLWFVVVDLPSGSRIEYQLEVSIEGRHDRFNDPFNPRLAHNP